MSDVFHEFDRENNIMPSELDVTMPAIELTTLAQVEERITDISKSNVGRDRLVHMVSDMVGGEVDLEAICASV